MIPDLSKFFHRFSKDHTRGHAPIASNPEEWPDEWKTTYYKTYERFPSIPLSDISAVPLTASESGVQNSSNFFELIKGRQSRRNFTRGTMTLSEMSTLLKYSCGNTGPYEIGRHRRAHPSGGGRFPIEVYPIIFRDVPDIKAGLYHYNVREHALDTLWQKPFSDEELDTLFTYDWVKHATGVLVMTAAFWRSQNKYGERGYRYVLLEAGHIGQNIYLTTSALGLRCCSLVGTRDDAIEELLDIDGISESVVYAVVIGR